MRFPSSHVPANLTKVSFTGPFTHVPVNLGVDESAPQPEICWDRWQNQQSHRLRIEFNDEWQPQEPDAIRIDWLCTDEICLGLWEDWPGNQVDFDFTHDKWTSVPGDEVSFDFTCYTDDGECTTLWTDYQSNQVPISFTKPWVEYQSNQVPIAFECDGGGGSGDDFIFFTGYFDNLDGQVSEIDFVITSIVNGYTGEALSLSLNDFSETIHPHFFTGERVGGENCVETVGDLQSVASRGDQSSIINVHPRTVILRTANGTTDGVNIVPESAIYVGGQRSTQVSWRQLLSGTVYDNDNTDAAVSVGFMFTDDPQALTSSGAGRYSNVFHNGVRTSNPRWVAAWLPFGTDVPVGDFVHSDQRVLTYTPYDKGSIDLFNGSNLITLALEKTDARSVEISLYVNDDLIGSAIFDEDYPEYIVPVWHYHNYQRNASSVELTDINFNGCTDFLTTYPMQGFGLIEQGDGEAFEVEIATTYAIPFDFIDGENLFAHVSADSRFDDVDFHTGEYFQFDIQTFGPPEFFPNFYSGESTSVVVATSTLFQVQGYDGSVVELDLTESPQPNILLDVQDGQTAQFALSISQHLNTLSNFTGEAAQITDLDFDQFWRMYQGESVSVHLSTEETVESTIHTGEELSVSLDIRPSSGIGMLRAYDGARFDDLVVNVLTAIHLYPNRISARDEMYCEFDINTSFDLNNTACCPVGIDTHERIELTDQPAPDEKYHGDKLVVQADLSALVRLDIDFYSGDAFRAVDPNYLGFIDAYDGHAPNIENIDSEFLDIKLCYGNFIPDGDFAFIELISEYDDNCVSDLMFTGESASFDLENTVGIPLNMYEGQVVNVNVTIDPIMLLRFYTGEYVRISNPMFEPRFYHGEYVTHDYYEAPWNFYHGEEIEPVTVTTDYDVEFLERGCLDNEYVPSNEHGDPDWDKFNPVPVELEFFSHSIKAHCF